MEDTANSIKASEDNYSKNNLSYFQNLGKKELKNFKEFIKNLKYFILKIQYKIYYHSGLYILNKIIPLILIQSSWIYKFNAFKVGIK